MAETISLHAEDTIRAQKHHRSALAMSEICQSGPDSIAYPQNYAHPRLFAEWQTSGRSIYNKDGDSPSFDSPIGGVHYSHHSAYTHGPAYPSSPPFATPALEFSPQTNSAHQQRYPHALHFYQRHHDLQALSASIPRSTPDVATDEMDQYLNVPEEHQSPIGNPPEPLPAPMYRSNSEAGSYEQTSDRSSSPYSSSHSLQPPLRISRAGSLASQSSNGTNHSLNSNFGQLAFANGTSPNSLEASPHPQSPNYHSVSEGYGYVEHLPAAWEDGYSSQPYSEVQVPSGNFYNPPPETPEAKIIPKRTIIPKARAKRERESTIKARDLKFEETVADDFGNEIELTTQGTHRGPQNSIINGIRPTTTGKFTPIEIIDSQILGTKKTRGRIPKARDEVDPHSPGEKVYSCVFTEPFFMLNNSSCRHCSSVFKRSEHLNRHIRSIHGNEKPFKCSKCDKKFSRVDNMEQHERVHDKNSVRPIRARGSKRPAKSNRRRAGSSDSESPAPDFSEGPFNAEDFDYGEYAAPRPQRRAARKSYTEFAEGSEGEADPALDSSFVDAQS